MTNIKFAVSIVVMTFGYLFAVTFLPISATGNEHAKTIVGFLLATGLATLINYFWGNSKKQEPDPEFPKMDEAVKAGTEKLQAAQVEAVKTEGEGLG